MTGTLHEDQYTFLIISRSFFHGMRNFSDKCRREDQTTHFNSVTFIQKSCRLRDTVDKYCRAEQATDDNLVTAHFILDN